MSEKVCFESNHCGGTFSSLSSRSKHYLPPNEVLGIEDDYEYHQSPSNIISTYSYRAYKLNKYPAEVCSRLNFHYLAYRSILNVSLLSRLLHYGKKKKKKQAITVSFAQAVLSLPAGCSQCLGKVAKQNLNDFPQTQDELLVVKAEGIYCCRQMS